MISEIKKRKSELGVLCRRYKVRRLELFGSATSVDFDSAESDLDFLVEFDLLASGEYFDSYFGLREDLEKLFDRPVDLVVDAAIKNPYFRESIERNKALLYGA